MRFECECSERRQMPATYGSKWGHGDDAAVREKDERRPKVVCRTQSEFIAGINEGGRQLSTRKDPLRI